MGSSTLKLLSWKGIFLVNDLFLFLLCCFLRSPMTRTCPSKFQSVGTELTFSITFPEVHGSLSPHTPPPFFSFSLPSEDREGSFQVTLPFFLFFQDSQQAINILSKVIYNIFSKNNKNHRQDLKITGCMLKLSGLSALANRVALCHSSSAGVYFCYSY